MKAVIFDFHKKDQANPTGEDDRADFMENALKKCGWTCKSFSEVHVIGQPGPDNLLANAMTGIEECQLVMLHLGREEGCGNDDSWRYLENKLVLLGKKICLIAYTGASACDYPEPSEFAEYAEKWPWRYFNGVNKPQDINLEEFAKEWGTHPDNDPPLELLSFNPRIGALKLLILGFQRGHEGNNDALAKMRNWTERSDWWQPVVGKDSRGQTLIDALNNAGEKRFIELANELVAFCSQPEDTANTLPEKLKEKLCAFPLSNEGAA